MTASELRGRPSILMHPDRLPLRPERYVENFGATLVVAPHPDDESLGCGGAIALLARAGIPVRILFVSDGSGSHPGSLRYPPERLRALREDEARCAMHALGVPEHHGRFLRLPDRSVPRIGSAGFARAVEQCRECIWGDAFRPETILLPWRRDPHTDHRGAWELIDAALCASPSPPRLLEYPIWLWDLGTDDDMPAPGEANAWRLDISSVLECKRQAISAHRSQTTRMIDDSDEGWYLRPDVIARFSRPWEVFLESRE